MNLRKRPAWIEDTGFFELRSTCRFFDASLWKVVLYTVENHLQAIVTMQEESAE